jgi:protein TonB
LHLGATLLQGPTREPRPLDERCAQDATEYPDDMERRGIAGSVLLQVRISDEGRVAGSEVVESSGHAALDEAARRGVRRCRFEPALRDGRPVWTTLRFRITFRLDGRSSARW